MVIKSLVFIVFFFTKQICFSQVNTDSAYSAATKTFAQLLSIIESNGSFKQAVFLSEGASSDNVSNDKYFNRTISNDAKLISRYSQRSHLVDYKQSDSSTYLMNLSLYTFLCNEISIRYDSIEVYSKPFTYNFNDPQGDKNFSDIYVSTLLTTHQGNCRSLTYLYKILADELGVKCWLALAPNHIYIRNYSKKIGWYNTELTSGTFPTDAWIAATGYVSTDAIRSGVYMDTLSNQQSIALCLLDLAHGYINQTNNYTDGFVLKCCNTVLNYHPANPMALLLKAETLKKIYFKQEKNKNPSVQTTYKQMEESYITLAKLGYREMSYSIYQKWLKTIHSNAKYLNSKITTGIKPQIN